VELRRPDHRSGLYRRRFSYSLGALCGASSAVPDRFVSPLTNHVSLLTGRAGARPKTGAPPDAWPPKSWILAPNSSPLIVTILSQNSIFKGLEPPHIWAAMHPGYAFKLSRMSVLFSDLQKFAIMTVAASTFVQSLAQSSDPQSNTQGQSPADADDQPLSRVTVTGYIVPRIGLFPANQNRRIGRSDLWSGDRSQRRYRQTVVAYQFPLTSTGYMKTVSLILGIAAPGCY
jgi:hypothetical protein